MPLSPFVATIVAPGWSWEILIYMAVSAAIILAMGKALAWLFEWGHRNRLAIERASYQSPRSDRVVLPEDVTERFRLVTIPWLGGAGAIGWRQSTGAIQQWGGLSVALVVPAVLACIPLTYRSEPITAFLAVVAAICFYSFLLLPTALKFDFRRDIDRMFALRSLPIRAAAVVVGQLVCPVLITCLFQATVVGIACLARPIHPSLAIGAMVVMLPMNVLIFALDNLLFLMYPYRPTQEGIGVFFRTTLIFTAKGLVFALALGLTAMWAPRGR